MRARLVLILFIGLLFGPFQPALATDGIDHGLLWKIEHDGIDTPSHIFGTVHSADDRVLELPGEVEAAFDNARKYLFEIELDRMLEGEGMLRMFYLDGRRLPDKLPDRLWARTREAGAAMGIGEQNLAVMKPWAVATALSVPSQDPTKILDYQLFERARALDRPVEGLETIDEQIGIFDDLELDRQIELLKGALEYFEAGQVEPMYERLIDYYLNRDLAAMVRMADDHPALPGSDDQAALMRRLVEERNRIMVTRMDSSLRDGGAFVAVGALHLPGESGIVRLLEERGYRLSVVY